MTKFNNTTVIKRYNRPSVLFPTQLDNYFANNGTYFDPNSVSAVYIFPDTGATNGSPDIYINRDSTAIGVVSAYGLIHTSALSSVVAYFDVSNSGWPGVGGDILNPSDYTPGDGSSVSSIYSGISGQYTVIADGAGDFTGLSSTGKYFDAWLVRDFSSSYYRLYWNKFELFNDRIISYTEPFQTTAKCSLNQKYISLSSIVTLRVDTDVFLANRELSEADKNIWRDSVITSGQIRIGKRNPRTTGVNTNIVSWTDVDDISSDDTMLYRWDTTSLETGDYIVQVKFNLLDQVIYSEEFSVVLR